MRFGAKTTVLAIFFVIAGSLATLAWAMDYWPFSIGKSNSVRIDEEDDNEEENSLPDIFADMTDQSNIKHTYRNGHEQDHYAILESLGGGVALIDFDGDGRLDIFVTGGGYYTGPKKKKNETIKGNSNRLYRNLGNFRFKDVTKEVGLDKVLFYSHGAAVCDYDRDGWPDLLVTGYGRLALYHNVPDGKGGRKFVDVTKEVGLLPDHEFWAGRHAGRDLPKHHFWSTSAAFGDLDGDGYPELYVCQYVDWSIRHNPKCPGYTAEIPQDVCPPKEFNSVGHALYQNVQGPNGTRRFVDVSRSAGLRLPPRKDKDYGKGLGVLMVDINGDGKPDIYVANDTTDNFLYLNQTRRPFFGGRAQLRFAELGTELLVARDGMGVPNGSMGVDAADYNGTGLASLWVTNYEGELHALYRNKLIQGRQSFVFSTEHSGIAAIGQNYVGFGTAFIDLTNRGLEDIVVSNGHVIRHPSTAPLRQKPVILQNQGDGRFKAVSRAGGPYFREGHIGRGMVVGDFDNDGWPDLGFSNLNEPFRILRNVAQQKYADHHWIGLQLKGEANRDVVGARVTVETSSQRLVRFAKGGGSYMSSGDRRLLIGLGNSKTIKRVTVEWSAGWPRRETWFNPKVDRYHALIQGTSNVN